MKSSQANEANLSPGTLQEQVTRYKQVFNVMPAGVILLDTKGVVYEVNPEASRLLGNELVGRRWFSIIQSTFEPQEDDGHEISLKNGKKVQLAISASETGQLILVTDLTETRLLQARLGDLQRLSSLGKMVASLAHQVRTPLSSAILYASNLMSPNITTEIQKRFQGKLLDRLYDLEKQVGDMLLFAQGGDNKVIRSFCLKELVAEFSPMIETVIHRHKIDYCLKVEGDDVKLLGNANAIASGLSNLIINAIQACGDGAQIDVFFRPVKNELKISVQDNGPGIPSDIQKKILEPFFTTRSQGTGLGLAVVQMVCNAHKGTLDLLSEEGEGTCFTMSLPLSK